MEANHIKFSSFDFIKVKGDTIELNSPETQFFFLFFFLGVFYLSLVAFMVGYWGVTWHRF